MSLQQENKKSNMILNTGNYSGEEPPEYFQFKYEPDHFQKWGFDAIAKNDNILVTAHTGAGKTALALYAIGKYLTCDKNPELSDDDMVIYTSPIKTLSNQKFKEFGEYFDDVGILTGDVKINPTGKLLIMTAEILRNSLLRRSDETVYEWNFNPNKVKCVILDEVHFINNPDRGKVWEEIITNLDPKIQLVMLSATISGAEKLASWVGSIKNKPCHLIPTPFRPVPLHHYIFHNNHASGKSLHCIKDNTSWNERVWTDISADIKKKRKGKSRKNVDLNQLFECIDYCKVNDIMPVNVFLLNRSLAEIIAKKIPFNLNDHNETSQVIKLWNTHLLKYRDIYEKTDQWEFILNLAKKGVGVHHSGIIPILKEMVEILYENKLVKVLIATETFAMGVNMPTRTVIFTQTTKYDGKGTRPLRPEEYIQMAGRAGRRGLDDFGTVIILPETDIPSEADAKSMIMSPPQKINSKLEIDYSFILKRITRKLDDKVDMKTDEYIIESINNTMFAKEIKSKYANISTELIAEKLKIEAFDDLKDCFQKFQDYKEMDNKVKSQRTSFIKLSQKLLKKYIKECKSYEIEFKDKIDRLNNWYSIYSNILEMENQLNFANSQYKSQVNMILEFLRKFNITKYEDNDYTLTPLGRIVSEVNECNPIVLGHIISNNYLDELEFEEIVAFLSIFIADRSVEEPYFSDLTISDNFNVMLNDVSNLVDNMLTEETDINNKLPFIFWSNWDLHLSMFNVIKEWSNGKKRWVEVKHLYETFEGNFCRNVLRLVNLIRNVESIARLTNNITLLNKLDGYEEKLIRDVVMIDSLYL